MCLSCRTGFSKFKLNVHYTMYITVCTSGGWIQRCWLPELTLISACLIWEIISIMLAL